MAVHQILLMTGPGEGLPRIPAGADGVCVVVRLGPPAARTGLHWVRGL